MIGIFARNERPDQRGLRRILGFNKNAPVFARNERPDQRGLRLKMAVHGLFTPLTRNERPDQRGLRLLTAEFANIYSVTRNERPDQRGLRQRDGPVQRLSHQPGTNAPIRGDYDLISLWPNVPNGTTARNERPDQRGLRPVAVGCVFGQEHARNERPDQRGLRLAPTPAANRARRPGTNAPIRGDYDLVTPNIESVYD